MPVAKRFFLHTIGYAIGKRGGEVMDDKTFVRVFYMDAALLDKIDELKLVSYISEPFLTAASTPPSPIEPTISVDTEQSFSQLQYFEKAEPSYGGYEPLKNPIQPECVSRFTREKGITLNKTQRSIKTEEP